MTDNQKRIIRYIREFTAGHGFPPSLAEIGDAVGLTDGGVKYVLMGLRNLGVVDWDDRKARTIRVIKEVGK